MKKITLFVAMICLVLGAVANDGAKPLTAKEAKNIDLSGKWVGKRLQFDASRTTIAKTFEYEFELKQEGSQITGFSTIINENGDYADIELKGTLIGNQLHFAEYRIRSQAIQEDKVWCLKNGQLTVYKDGDALYLSGKTDSYMDGYLFPCTGGITQLSKVDNSSNAATLSLKTEELTNNVNLTVTPNPFVYATKINYTLPADSKVSLEILDIMGRTIAMPETNVKKSAGAYTIDYNQVLNTVATGVFIAKLTVNGEVYSTQMIQVNNK